MPWPGCRRSPPPTDSDYAGQDRSLDAGAVTTADASNRCASSFTDTKTSSSPGSTYTTMRWRCVLAALFIAHGSRRRRLDRGAGQVGRILGDDAPPPGRGVALVAAGRGPQLASRCREPPGVPARNGAAPTPAPGPTRRDRDRTTALHDGQRLEHASCSVRATSSRALAALISHPAPAAVSIAMPATAPVRPYRTPVEASDRPVGMPMSCVEQGADSVPGRARRPPPGRLPVDDDAERHGTGHRHGERASGGAARRRPTGRRPAARARWRARPLRSAGA